jgi:DNA-binding HxlR family transcriptional regulator
MDFNSIPEAFQTKLRIAVVAALYGGGKDFITLREITGATDGNLCVQLSKLEEMGYLVSRKSFMDKKPHTDYMLTEEGKNAFSAYVLFLENILKNS